MKNVSETFKEAIKQYGRQIDVIIEYTENGIEKFLDVDTLFSVTPIVNSNLLKSVMKQLNFESSVKVPKGTWINVRFGVLIEKGLTVQEVHQMRVDRLNSTEVRMIHGFEYINLGKYLVAEEPEYNADTLSYSHKCFDRMIFAMQNYEVLNIEYPITLKNFLYAVANKLNINVKNADFYNQNREIQKELYEGLEYTYRDVLDEIAQATGSIICINDNDELEVRYLNNTNETIDEGFLKDVNVTMKEKYGTINTIVLSRSDGTDNIYYPETLPENPIEIKISDNQIMNWNDRSDYLPELYQALNGIEYYVNDFKSTGITYLEVGDKYNIQIGENTYNCVLLNDEIDITQGLEEQIYTDMPEQSQTDYKKADKTDRDIKQTRLIVDKQKQEIMAEVNKKVNNTDYTKAQIILKINDNTSQAQIDADVIDLSANDILNLLAGNSINLSSKNITITANNFSVDSNGNITATGGTVGGFALSPNQFQANLTYDYTYTQADVDRIKGIIMETISPTSEDFERYDLDFSGKIEATDYMRVKHIVESGETTDAIFKINTEDSRKAIQILDDNGNVVLSFGRFSSYFKNLTVDNIVSPEIQDILSQKLLWQGSSLMDVNDTVTLSEDISDQVKGVVLVFSAYRDGQAQDWGWYEYFVPREMVINHSGQGHSITIPHYGFDYGIMSSKYIYISDDRLTGNANNVGTHNNLNNSLAVLRYVIGL